MTVLVFQSALCVPIHMQRQSMCQKPEVSRVKWNKVWGYGGEGGVNTVRLWNE